MYYLTNGVGQRLNRALFNRAVIEMKFRFAAGFSRASLFEHAPLKFRHNHRVERFKIVSFFFCTISKVYFASPLPFHFHVHLGVVTAIAISDRNDQRKYPFHVERVNTLAKLEYYLMNYHRPNGIARGITAQFRYSCIHALRTYIIDRNRCTRDVHQFHTIEN